MSNSWGKNSSWLFFCKGRERERERAISSKHLHVRYSPCCQRSSSRRTDQQVLSFSKRRWKHSKRTQSVRTVKAKIYPATWIKKKRENYGKCFIFKILSEKGHERAVVHRSLRRMLTTTCRRLRVFRVEEIHLTLPPTPSTFFTPSNNAVSTVDLREREREKRKNGVRERERVQVII